jgi:hypothetical protein
MPPTPEGVTDAEWFEHLEIMKALGDYDIVHPKDEPILDAEELRNPRIHEWRNKMKQINKKIQ